MHQKLKSKFFRYTFTVALMQTSWLDNRGVENGTSLQRIEALLSLTNDLSKVNIIHSSLFHKPAVTQNC